MEAENKSGIYTIISKITGQIYVGQTNNFKSRWYNHERELRKNIHYNYRLQEIYNTYGPEDLVFSVLEYCDPVKLNNREQFYIDNLNPEINMTDKAVSGGGRRPRNYSDIYLVSPDGRVFTEIENLSKFCVENDICYTSFFHMLNHAKYRKTAIGWSLIEDYNEPEFTIEMSDLSKNDTILDIL